MLWKICRKVIRGSIDEIIWVVVGTHKFSFVSFKSFFVFFRLVRSMMEPIILWGVPCPLYSSQPRLNT